MIAKYILLAAGLLAVTNGGAAAQSTAATSSPPLPFISPIFGYIMVMQGAKLNTL